MKQNRRESEVTKPAISGQERTAKTCYNMYKKWADKKALEKDGLTQDRSIRAYIRACADGYPRGTKLSPGLLKTRIRSIEIHLRSKQWEYEPKDISSALEEVEIYRKAKQ